MAGDIKDKYVASSTLTTTALQSLASSQDWTAGWGSASISNLTDLNLDGLLGGTFTTHASNRQAGSINIYLISPLNDTPTWPASSSGTIGTEGAIAFTDTEERDAACMFLASITVDNTASAVMPFPMRAIAAQFSGELPTHFVIYISQNCSTTTTAGLASSGNALYYTGKLKQYT